LSYWQPLLSQKIFHKSLKLQVSSQSSEYMLILKLKK
jgi:hypothetical protein